MARARSGMYGLLARVYRCELDVTLLQQLCAPHFATVLKAAGVDIEDVVCHQPKAALLDELAVEYTRLFIGPGPHISPHESVHRADEGRLWGEAAVTVNRFIASLGFTFKTEYRGLPDHISLELELLQALTDREAEAWVEGAAAMAEECRRIQGHFFEHHLGRWAPAFCSKVIAAAEHPFYRDMASMTQAFLSSEQQVFGSAVVSGA